MGLFCSDKVFERDAVIQIMHIACEDWNRRYAETRGQAIGIHEDSYQTIEMILEIGDRILTSMFTGDETNAYKRVATFMVMSGIYPFLFARNQGDEKGLLDLAGSHIKNFQAYFNIESAPLLLALASQETDSGNTVTLDTWQGFNTKEIMEETWKVLVSTSQIARTNKPGSMGFDPFAIGIQILALSLIIENAYLASTRA